MNEHSPDERPEPLYLLDIHHSGYLGWGVWCGPEMPEQWTAETVERLYKNKRYKMGLNLGGQTYEWYPQFSARIARWLAEFPDRLFITGGDYAQPTACVRTGESNLRQLLYGLEAIRDALGTEVAIWTASEPGNFSQLPQILLDLGYRGALLRIHGPGQGGSLTPRADLGSVWWVGPDGSRILAVPEYNDDRTEPKAAVPYSMWIMTRYRNTHAARGNYSLDDLWAWKEMQAAKGIAPVVMSKDDDQNNQYGNNNLCMSSGHLLAADTEHDERFRWVTAEELFDELPEPEVCLEADPNLFETRKNSFCDYGYRTNLDWLSDFQAEEALRLADWATVVAARLGVGSEYEDQLALAWKRHLMAQNHDLSLKGSLRLAYHLQYEALHLAQEACQSAMGAVIAEVDTGSSLGAVVVANPLGWERTDYAQVAVPRDVAEQGGLWDGDVPVPWEVVRRDAERVVMGFVATVPALGYRTYRIEPQAGRPAPRRVPRVDAQSLRVETDAYAVQFLPEGGLEGAWTKSGARVAAPHSFVLAGDVGDGNYRSRGRVSSIQAGAVSAQAFEEGRIGPHHAYQMTYRFVNGVPYIACDIFIRADFQDGSPGAPGIIGASGHKLGAELGFPQSLEPITCMRKQPFLVWPYLPEIDPVFAALYWVDWSSPQAGVALLNRGTVGHQWDQDGRRVSNILATGQMSDLKASLGLLPHDGGWLEGGVHQAGLRFGHPLYCAYEPAHPGRLPRQFQLCRVEPDSVTVSSVFRARGKSYLRLFEHAGRAANLEVRVPGGKLAAKRVDLRLEPITEQPQVGAHGIVTLELDWG